MARYVYTVLVCAVLAAAAEPEQDAEGGYGLRYDQRQREGRREVETSEGFTPSQGVQEVQREGVSEVNSASRNVHRQSSISQQEERVPEDSSSDGSSYRTVVVHDNPGRQRSNVHYQTLRKKPTKNRQKVHRQVHGETSNYKSLKSTKPADPPPHLRNNLPPTTSAPGDPFVHAVHPSIMQNLLKQQPQTFDVPQEKESDKYEQGPINFQSQNGFSKSKNEGLKSFHSDFGSQSDVTGQQESFDVSKRPIYVPNRVSVQSPSSDTSFNVGYSIGFGGGVAQPPRMGIVQPPVNLRHGKELLLPSSYQNTPVNVHIDGTNTVWKNMGSGVEMSHHVDTKFESPNQSNSDTSDRHVYSSGSVINQPIFYREGFDHNFNSISTSGRNSFDHNHALQQSNSFDFSNAIDPITNHPYTPEQQSNLFLSAKRQPLFAESFPKQPVSSFTESHAKRPHSSYSETFNKQPNPSFIRSQSSHDSPRVESPQYTQAILTPIGTTDSGGVKYEGTEYEKQSFSTNLQGSIRTPNSINLKPKSKTSEFTKYNPDVAKSTYSFKNLGTSNNGLNQIHDDLFGNNFNFQSSPVLPPIYSHSGKITPPGMVQAILVPVNTPPGSLPYPIGMPVMGSGYSPYFGHPVGMLRIPEPIRVNNLPPKEGFENPVPHVSHHSENQQYQEGYHQSPAKLFQTQYVTRHHKEEVDPTQHHLSQGTSHSQTGEVPESQRSPKFKRVYSTEAPEPIQSSVKSHQPSSLRLPSFESSSFKEPSSQFSSVKEGSPSHYPLTTYHPRPYRTKKLVIVKRS